MKILIATLALGFAFLASKCEFNHNGETPNIIEQR